MNPTDKIIMTAHLMNQASQCNHTFIPISFMDSCEKTITIARGRMRVILSDMTRTKVVSRNAAVTILRVGHMNETWRRNIKSPAPYC